jgi:hypothetical protein
MGTASAIEVVARAVVVAAGAFFTTLGGLCLLAPSHASRFLLGFAGSPGRHYAELALRLLVGGAFVFAAPGMRFPSPFAVFGWTLLVTTAGLLLTPWRWHQRFAQRTVPAVLRFLPWVGVSSVLLGGMVLAAVLQGNAG